MSLKENKEGKISGLSIAALIFSILGCTFIIGIILSIIDLCKKDGRKKTCSIIALVISIVWIILAMAIGGNDSSTNQTSSSADKSVSTEIKEDPVEPEIVKEPEVKEEQKVEEVKEEPAAEEKSKYYVGDTWQNKYIKVIYTKCYEFTDYNQYNAPASGNKIICAEFEFENIGNSDETVMYTDFNGYADGYEVSQSYAPEGTGLDFSVKMSAWRKGTGIVAFEVPENAEEIEIEFSPNFWTSENVIFVYQ